MESFELQCRHLFELTENYGRSLEGCLAGFQEHHPNLTRAQLGEVRRFLSRNFLPKLRRFWERACRNRERFEEEYAEWLAGKFTIQCREGHDPSASSDPPSAYDNPSHGDSDSSTPESFSGASPPWRSPAPGPSRPPSPRAGPSRTPGRPAKPYSESSARTRRRKIAAAKRQIGEDVLDDIVSKRKVTPERALALIVDNGISKRTYQDIRAVLSEVGLNPFPAYNKVLEVKKACYPTDVEVSENHAEVKLRSLLKHTVERLVYSLPAEEIGAMPNELTLTGKWGSDGSSGHNEFKQTFAAPESSDRCLFMTTMVPLRLQNQRNESQIFWNNPTPSSSRWCRPVRFEMIQESPEVIKAEYERMRDEIANLGHVICSVRGRTFLVDFDLVCSMIDGKVLQTVNETPSMQTCSLCGSTPKEMNNLEMNFARAEPDESRLVVMSPLHARIKFMENLLKVAYNQTFKKWTATGEELQNQKAETKRRIQEGFKAELGLKVDYVRQGAGSTNDGNTSRRFFADPEIVAEITGIDEILVKKFGTILKAINCNRRLKADEFNSYCRETAQRYVSLYPWYPMTNSVHKVLVHGCSIVSNSPMPIGAFSEEAQEAQNKIYRRYRLDHSRKISRVATNQDVVNMMLAASDPFINTFRRIPRLGSEAVEIIDEELKTLLVESETED